MRTSASTWLLALSFALVSCSSDKAPDAEDESFTANFILVDAISDTGVLVQAPGADEFTDWDMNQPIPGGAVLRTPASVRATVSLPHDGTLTMNHSTDVSLSGARKIEIIRGQAVVEYNGGPKENPITVVLPQGEAVLHGTKVGFVVGSKDSSVTVSQGLVEVMTGEATVEARPGQEVVVRDGTQPVVTQTPELGRRLGWAELGERASLDKLPEVPRGLGKLVGKVPGEGETEHRLDLLKHSVDVKIQGNLAYTEIHEAFQNGVDKTLEGIYRFPLPPGARISRLSLKVGDKWMEGEFLDNERAQEIWDDVKKPVGRVKKKNPMKKIEEWVWVWKDPALLKWKEGNTFELRIFPIPAQEVREVKIGYVERLDPSASGYSYTYPMPVDRAGLIPAKRFEFSAELYGFDATQTLEVTGYEAELKTGATQNDQAVATIKWAEDDFVARGDFDIRFGRRDAVGLRTSTYAESAKDPFSVFVIRPNLPAPLEVKPRDFVVLLDRSLSRDGAALDVQREVVPRMIREMDPLDRVTVIACNEQCEPVGAPTFENARHETAEKVQNALNLLQAGGATYPVEAVRVAGELFRRRGHVEREAHVIYFTDGVASIGELRPGKVGESVRAALGPFEARMSVVNVGGDIDKLLLEALATAGRGRVVELDPMLSMTGQSLDILNGHYRSILEQPKLSLPPGVVAEAKLPNAIAAGDEIVIAARFKGAVTGEFNLSGGLGGENFTTRYPVRLSPSVKEGNKFVPGEWATQRIERLELAEEGHRDEIVELSVTYGVLSRHTSLLALESDQMMRQYKVEKHERTQWTGEEAAEEVVTAEIPRRTARKQRPYADKIASKPRPSVAPSSSRSADGLFGGDLGGSFDADFEPRPRQRRGRYVKRTRYVPMVKVALIQSASEPSTWERNNVERQRKRMESEPANRTRRMSHVRAMIRARDIAAATTSAQEWLATNPMDAEARVLLAQLQAQAGNIEGFYSSLVESLDAAPRGRWLQERVHRAALAQADIPLACAMGAALQATAKTPSETVDILACPLATQVGVWFGEPAPAALPPLADDSTLSGALTVSLESSGGDWDIVLLEPSGRPLWWGSARNGLKVRNVRGKHTERLAVPALRNGTYSIMAVPRSGVSGDVLTVSVQTSTRGQARTFRVTAPSAAPFEVAEVLQKWQ